jgi:hypothetical protein
MAMTALTLAATGYQAYAQREAGEAQEAIAKRNAKLLERSADDALARGNEEVIAHRRRTRMLVGSQRATAAAQGLDVNSGVSLDLQDQATMHGAADEATIRRNAWREAYGIRTQAGNQRMEGRYARRAGTNQAIGTTLGGIGNAYAYWQADRAPRTT